MYTLLKTTMPLGWVDCKSNFQYFMDLVTFGRSIAYLILCDAICPTFSQTNPLT